MRSRAKFGRFGVRREIAMELLAKQQAEHGTADQPDRPLTDREADQLVKHDAAQFVKRAEASHDRH